MTEAELAAIEARANAADIGPWEYRGGGIHWPAPNTPAGETITDGVHEHDPSGEVVDEFRSFTREENAAFIAHSRADIPALIAEVRRLRGVAREIGVKVVAVGEKAMADGDREYAHACARLALYIETMRGET